MTQAPELERRRHDQVARLVAEGLLNKQVGAALGISERQVKRIVGEIARAWSLDPRKSIRVQIANRYRGTNGP